MENTKEKNELMDLLKMVEAAKNPEELKGFLHYFANEFFDDFHRYFKVTRTRHPYHYEIVLYCDAHFNPCRKNFHFRDEKHKKYFAIALFYSALLPQGVGFVCGETVMIHFNNFTSTAWISCGMHGIGSPILIVKESDLFDQLQEGMELLEDAMPVMHWWLENILTGEVVSTKNPSLKHAIDVVQGETMPRVKEIWEACEMHVEALKKHIADPQRGFPMKFFNDYSCII